MEKHIILFFFCLTMFSNVYSLYIHPKFYDLVGTSDLIVYGNIKEVKEFTFVLDIKEVLAGIYTTKEIEIHQFHDWRCAQRWKAYHINQTIIAFIDTLSDISPKYKISKYILRSVGPEGEFPVIDGIAYCLVRIPGAELTDGKPLWAYKFKLETMLSAIKEYKNLFKFTYDKESGDRILTIEVIGNDDEIEIYKKKSFLHDYLIVSTLKKNKTLPWINAYKEVNDIILYNLKLRFHYQPFRIDSINDSVTCPHYQFILDKEVIWDYPNDFIGKPNEGRINNELYPYGTESPNIYDFIIEYKNTSKEELLIKDFENDYLDIVDILRVADYRIDLKQLLEFEIEDKAAKKVLKARLSIK